MFREGEIVPKSKAIINIENVVASATLNQKVDLNAVVKGYPGVEYRPEQFPGLVFRLKRPKTATLIFSSGKMVCTGAKSEKEARRAVMKVIKELKRGGIIIISKPELKIQNIVASGILGGLIDLEKAAFSLGKTMYEPEQFPGLIYRMEEPKVVILLFASGKLVCTGAKHEQDVYDSELVETFRTLRLLNLSVWARLSSRDLQRSWHHNERGAESLAMILRVLAGHDLSHLHQISREIHALESRG